MKASVSRRSFLGAATGAVAAVIAGVRGWRPQFPESARAAVRWRLLAPITGQIGVCNYHCGACGGAPVDPCDNALDFMYRTQPNDTKVKLYILNDNNVAGYGAILSQGWTCSQQDNPNHRRITYNLATNAFVLLGVGVSSHVVPTAAIGSLVSGNGGQIANMSPSTDVFRAGCYEGTHVHFGVLSGTGYPTSMNTLPITWANTWVTAGLHAPWETYI